MALPQARSFGISASLLLFALFINTCTHAASLPGQSANSHDHLPRIWDCLSQFSVSAPSFCNNELTVSNQCLCSMVSNAAESAAFADCVMSCSVDEKITLGRICGASDEYANNIELKRAASGDNSDDKTSDGKSDTTSSVETDSSTSSVEPSSSTILIQPTSTTSVVPTTTLLMLSTSSISTNQTTSRSIPTKAPPINHNKTTATASSSPTQSDNKGDASLMIKCSGWASFGTAIIAGILML